MSTAVTPRPTAIARAALPAAADFVVAALRSLTWREVGYFALIGLLVAALNAASAVEWSVKGEATTRVLADTLLSLVTAPLILAGWLLADRAGGAPSGRPRRLACGVLGGAAVAALLAPSLLLAIGLDLNPPLHSKVCGICPRPAWVLHLTLFINIGLYSGLAVAVLEVGRRRVAIEQAVDHARSARAALSRQVLESRLAAMQAQVEPHFLFEALRDIESLYRRDPVAAAAHLERLITYLRVALPRLRESGSSIEAEVQLAQAYLGVVQALHDGHPQLRLMVEPNLAGRTFHPMLLLPLLQRAVRRTQGMPATIDLRVTANGDQMRLALRIHAAALCAEDDDLARVRERLAGLYGARAALTCNQTSAGVTEFNFMLPL